MENGKVISGNDDSKIWGLIGVALGLIGFIVVLLAKKDDKYAMFYAKQGLVLTIAGFIVSIFGMIPILGWIVAPLVSIALLVFWIIGIVYSLSGQEKNIPVIGDIASKINL